MHPRALALAVLAASGLLAGPASAQETTLEVMSYNIWGGFANEGKPVDETVAVIRAAGACAGW